MITTDTHLVDRFVESVVGRSIGRSVDATRRPLIAAKCLHLHAITQRWHRCRGIIKTSVPGIYIYIYYFGSERVCLQRPFSLSPKQISRAWRDV